MTMIINICLRYCGSFALLQCFPLHPHVAQQLFFSVYFQTSAQKFAHFSRHRVKLENRVSGDILLLEVQGIHTNSFDHSLTFQEKRSQVLKYNEYYTLCNFFCNCIEPYNDLLLHSPRGGNCLVEIL